MQWWGFRGGFARVVWLEKAISRAQGGYLVNPAQLRRERTVYSLPHFWTRSETLLATLTVSISFRRDSTPAPSVYVSCRDRRPMIIHIFWFGNDATVECVTTLIFVPHLGYAAQCRVIVGAALYRFSSRRLSCLDDRLCPRHVGAFACTEFFTQDISRIVYRIF